MEQLTDVTFPNEPEMSDHPYCLPEGAIGWATNGVAIFNPFAAGQVGVTRGPPETRVS